MFQESSGVVNITAFYAVFMLQCNGFTYLGYGLLYLFVITKHVIIVGEQPPWRRADEGTPDSGRWSIHRAPVHFLI